MTKANKSQVKNKIKILLKSVFVIGLTLLVVSYYQALGPMPWKDRLSRNINQQLKNKLENKEDANLSDIFQEKGSEIYFIFLPPYFNLVDIDCPTFSQPYLKSLKIKRSLQDGISRFILVDSRQIVAETTIDSRKLLCQNSLEPVCIPLHGTLLKLTTAQNQTCYNLTVRI